MGLMNRRWLIFGVCSANFFFSQLYRTTNAVISPYLVRDLSLDSEGLGLLAAAFFYSFALAQVPILLCIDKIGPRRIMTFLGVLGVAGAVIFALAREPHMAVLGRLTMGIGMSCAFIGSLKLLSVWFSPVVFATVSGFLTSVGTLGNIVSTSPLAAMAETLGWRESMLLMSTVHALVVIGLWIIVRDKPEDWKEELYSSSSIGNVFLLLKTKDFWLISLATFFRYGTFASLQALWAGPLLIMVLKLSPMMAGNVILAMSIGTIAGFPLWGILSDNIFRTRRGLIVIGIFSMALVMFTLAYLKEGTHPIILGFIFFLLGLFTASGQLMYAQVKELFSPEMAGAAMTGINFFNMLGPAFFLQFLGIAMSTFYPGASLGEAAFRMAIFICVFCLLVAGFLCLMTKETVQGK